jgi:DNA topoisomerase-1
MQPTNLGMKVSDLLTDNFAQVTGSEMTAIMEDNLDEISQGKKQYLDVVKPFWEDLKGQVESKFGSIKEHAQEYRVTATDQKCFVCSGKMVQKLGRFGEYYQCEAVKEHIFPLNFIEYSKVLSESKEKYKDQLIGKKCEECKKPLIVRVSKSSLKPYIACEEYKVGNKHTVTDITFGGCPKCKEEGRTGKKQGQLVERTSRKFNKKFISCNLPIKECGYIQKEEKKETDENGDNNDTIVDKVSI